MNKIKKIFIWFCTTIISLTLLCYYTSANEEDVVEKSKIEIIQVKDIEISDFEDTLEVGETNTLSVSVLPTDANEQTVFYKSSNTSIATVSQSGEVKGIMPGDVKITVSAGKIKKELNLTVKITSKSINVDKDYIVLKPNQTKQINAMVFPSNATDTKISYSSSDTSVATVSSTGLIKAAGCGSTSVVLKTTNSMALVTVIVNDSSNKTEIVEQAVIHDSEPNVPESVSVENCSVVSNETLERLYKDKKTLCITSNKYDIHIDGEKIKNTNNSLYTDIELSCDGETINFNLNKGKNLCGEVSISIFEAYKYKCLYLYDETSNKYQLIETSDITNLQLSTAGRYLLTNSKISHTKIPWVVISIAAGMLIILLCIYIIIKRKYWFW